MTNTFSGQILTEKLSKCNSSQQSIESLSQWCISHRKKAKQIVETWDKLFHAQKERQVSFLYLANDILQNSRRKGNEFVNEFWKYLPAALKDVFVNSDDAGKKSVSRLVDIWDERKVFGSRGRSLKDEMRGKEGPPSVENNGKNLNPIKIVKKDAHSLRIKLAVGGMPEKIVSALHSAHDEHIKEDTALNKCKAAVSHMEKMEKVVENSFSNGNQQALRNELQEQENILRQCIGQLESVEAARTSFIGQLKEILQDQESRLGYIHAQLQVGRAQIEQASFLRQKLSSSSPINMTNTTTSTNSPLAPSPQPITSFAPHQKESDDNNKKSAAAAVAAKLAAMTSSAQMLSSVLSSLAAEEAAASGGGFSIFPPPEKRARLERPMPITSSAYQHLPTSSPATTSQGSVHQFPPPMLLSQPPPPPYIQSSYVYGSNGGLPPPPPPPPPLSHMMMGISRPGSQPQPLQPLQPPQNHPSQQQQPLQPPQNHQSQQQHTQNHQSQQQHPLQPPQNHPPQQPPPQNHQSPQQKPLQPPQNHQAQQPSSGGGYYHQSPSSSGMSFYGSHQQQTPPPPVARQ